MIPPRIGIIGGMGPEATLLLQWKLFAATDAADDGGHIPLLVDMNPQVPSRIAFLIEDRGENPGPILAEMARRLETQGARALAMPCNTAHCFAPEIEQAVTIPLLHMPALAAAKAAERSSGAKLVGILASPATARTGLFSDVLAAQSLRPLYPKDQSAMLDAIRHIKADRSKAVATRTVQQAADELTEHGVGSLIIGCSEFSTIAGEIRASVPIIDALNALVDRIIDFANAPRKPTARPA
ncbi:MAG: aspartate/glutamate racemase family protein [Geminicoccales bacterium]